MRLGQYNQLTYLSLGHLAKRDDADSFFYFFYVLISIIITEIHSLEKTLYSIMKRVKVHDKKNQQGLVLNWNAQNSINKLRNQSRSREELRAEAEVKKNIKVKVNFV